jgi:hypothetical protein
LAVKYALIGSLVVIGLFAFAKRDFVIDAFHWDPHEAGLPIPAFDPVARAKQLATPPPTANALRVAQAADTRHNLLNGTGEAPSAPAVSLTGGSVSLTGTVTGPSGPVANATVRVERLVDDQVGTVDLTTNASGAFALANAPGGRYRVRAWRAPVLAQLGSEVAFVPDGQAKSFALQLSAPSGRDVDVEWSSSGWVLNGTPSVSLVVTEPYVNESGQVDLRGSGGLITTLSTGGALAGGGTGTTSAAGAASFNLRCATVGPTIATLSVGSYVRTLEVPSCSPPPTTTTTTLPPSTTTTSGAVPPGAPVTTAPAPPPTPTTAAG